MTSKNLFFKLMLENMKRRIWTLALGFLVFFFTLPVAEAFVFSDKRYYTYENYENYRRMIDGNALAIISAGNEFLVIVVVTAALICGVSSFAYLHSKKKVDFYHSLPVRRETLFAVSFVNGILIMAAVFYLTPAASEGYRSTLKPTAFQGKSPSSNLSAQVIHQEQPLSEKAALNPDWVEWLMGFPKGWTDVSSGPPNRKESPA